AVARPTPADAPVTTTTRCCFISCSLSDLRLLHARVVCLVGALLPARVGQRGGRVEQPGVREGLREVAHRFTGFAIDLFAIKTEVIGVLEQSLEAAFSFIHVSSARE